MLWSCRSDKIIVSTPLGNLTGQINSKGVINFLAVPFAEPPINELRFKMPKYPYAWKTNLDATKFKDACYNRPGPEIPHFPHLPPGQPQSEDCLHLDIYVDGKTIDPQAKAPVVVYIHGGTFVHGSSALYDFSLLIKGHAIIAVVIQYRLGVFGFSQSPDDNLIPGNLGLHDQVAAIKWVKQYISYFGGDPDSITLQGQSAGSMSISYHLVSPLMKNVFKRAIMESGSIFSLQIRGKDETEVIMKQLINYVGCDTKSTTEEQYNCLISKDARSLLYFGERQKILFTPTVDSRFFSNSKPFDLFKKYSNSSKLDQILIGHNGNEGALFIPFSRKNIINLCLPKWLYEHMMVSKEHQQLFKQIIDLTFEQESYMYIRDVLNRVGELLGDTIFGCSNYDFLNLLIPRNQLMKVYYYFFFPRPNWAVDAKTDLWPYIHRALHFEELQFVLGHPRTNLTEYTDEERNLSSRVITNWAKFVKTGTVDDPLWPMSQLKGEKVEFKYAFFENATSVRPETGFPPNRCDVLPRAAYLDQFTFSQFANIALGLENAITSAQSNETMTWQCRHRYPN